uniref:ATP synthase subunit b, chloroplastic n=1 Tax=Euglenaformis proxima TaxID=299110 RepID=A0A023HHP0_9EUGL|nr:ATPase subunit I [Euglenaformis proxima]AGL12017.1 ATPase subunit I [Euglenaformis proxima]
MSIVFDSNLNNIFSEAKGFGINTDIFETNILNLSVVIIVLIYYGRITLGDLIKSRKDIILKNIEEADNKLREATENLVFAKKNLELSILKAEEIKSQSKILATQTTKSLLETLNDDISRLKVANLSFVQFEENKSINEICEKLTFLSSLQAIEKLNKRLNSSLQKKIISNNIEKLSIKNINKK